MQIKDIEITIIHGDITQVATQAIVNAANNYFYMGGGVAGVIKKKGGAVIEDEAVKQGPVAIGEAVITQSGKLPSQYVIHASTMGLDFYTGEEMIRNASYNALCVAQKNAISSLAFCALGCGVGKFPYDACAKIMAQAVFKYVLENKTPSLKKIVFVLYDTNAYETFKENVESYLTYMYGKLSQGTFVTVDGIVEYEKGIIMVERLNPPFGWALPGGFVDYGESLEEAVVREIKEETHLDFKDYRQFKVYSRYGRDPRFHTITAVFVGKGDGTLKADSDAKNVQVVSSCTLPAKIAFDHRQIIEEYFSK